MKNALQTTLITSSGIVLLGALFFGVSFAGDFAKTNLFESSESPVNQVTVPLDYEARLNKGEQLESAGYLELAATEYALAIQIQEENPQAHAHLAEVYLKLNDPLKALPNAKRAYEIAPYVPEFTVLYGKTLIRNKSFELAAELFQENQEINQEAALYHGVLSSFYGNADEAKKAFQKAIETPGDLPHERIQAFQNAYLAFEDQQEGQSGYLKALLAQAMIDLEEYQLAEALTYDILNEENKYRDAWILYGYSKLKMEEVSSAIDAFDQAKKLDGTKPETHYFLGVSYSLQENYEAAVKSFELALLYGFQPEQEVYHKLAESQLYLEDYEEALAAYEHLIKIDPSNVEVFTKPLWISLSVLKDFNRALTLAEETVSHFPNSSLSHTLLAQVYVARGELEQAESTIDIAYDMDSHDPYAHYVMGQIREAQEDLEGAKWEYKKATEYTQATDLTIEGEPLQQAAAEAYNRLINPEENA